MAFQLPEEYIEETFLAATGPGGQNVNKVATACQLRVDIHALNLAPYAFRKLKELAGSKMNSAGQLIVTARSFRSREANREDARQRVTRLIDQAHVKKTFRVKTKPSRAAKKRRIEHKKGRGVIKKNRAKPRLD